MRNNKVYTVRACRWGDKESHSYIVGVYTRKHKALDVAQKERDWRGGKYECEVIEWKLDEGIDQSGEKYDPPKIIQPLPID